MWDQLKLLLKHSAIYGIGNIAISLLSFLLIPLYTHYLSVGEFGVYSLMIIVYSLMSLVVDLGLSSSVSRFYFDDEQQTNPEGLIAFRRKLLSTALCVTFVTSTGLALASYVSAGWVARVVFGSFEYGVYLRTIAATLFWSGVAAAPMMYLRMTERSVTFTAITCSQVFFFLALNVLFLARFRLGVRGVFYSLLVSNAVYSLLAVSQVARELRARFDFALARDLFRFGLPFLPVVLLKWVIDFSDRYLLDHYSTISSVGVYSLGYKFGQAMAFVVTAFTLGWVPIRFKILTLDDPRTVYGRIASFYVAVAGLAWLGLSVFSREIISMTSPAQFHQAALFIPPVAFGYLLYGLFVLALTGTGVAKQTSSLPFVMLAATLLNIGLNVILIPRIGSMGAALSTVGAFAMMLAGALYVSQRVYQIAYQYRTCGVLLGAIIVLWGVATVLPDHPLIFTVALKLILMAAYSGVILVSGVLRRSEWEKALGLVARFAPRVIRPSVAVFTARALAYDNPASASATPAPKSEVTRV